MPSILALARKAYDQKKFSKQVSTKRRVNAVIAKKTAKAAARKKRQQEAAKKAATEGADAPAATKKAGKKSVKKVSDKKKSFKPISTINKKGPAKKLTPAAKLKAKLYKKNKIPLVNKKKAKVQISTSKRAARMHRKKSWSKLNVKKTVAKKKNATVKKASAAAPKATA